MKVKRNEDGTYLCLSCGTPIPDYEPEWCCDGTDCNCRGLPVEPPICSPECDKKFYKM